jgi:hypothetical protein
MSLALSDTAELSFGFAVIPIACSSSSPAADCFRGGQHGEIRLLKNISVLHLAALHGADQVFCACAHWLRVRNVDSFDQVVCMLMKEGEALGVVADALCLAVVGKKQFKMTAMDIAGKNCDCVFTALPSTRGIVPTVSSSAPSSCRWARLDIANNTDMLAHFAANAAAWL